jgi:hypothetical protein
MKTHPNERHCGVEITAIERRVNKFAKIIRKRERERVASAVTLKDKQR